MRKRRAFRPAADYLEDRLVLSQTGISPPTAVASQVSAAQASTSAQFPPINYNAIGTQVNTAFNNFRTSYQTDQTDFLNTTPNGSGTGNTTLAQLQAETTQLAGTLASQLQTALTQVPGGLTGLLPLMEVQLSGQFSGSMVTALNSIPATTGTGGTADVLYPQVASNIMDSTQLALNNMLSSYFFAWNNGRTAARAGRAGAAQTLPDITQVAGQVNTNYNNFRTSYQTSETDFLNTTPNGSGTGNTTLAQLQANVATGTNQLNTQLGTALNTVPGATTGLIPFQQLQVNGQFSGALNPALTNIPATTGTGGTAGALYANASSASIDSAQLAANTMISAYYAGLNAGFTARTFPISHARGNPLTPAHLAIAQGYLSGIETAYTQFQTDYSNAVANTLYANVTPDPTTGMVDLTPNQAAFNAQVATALNTLNTSIASTLAPSPLTANTLVPAIQHGLVTNDMTGLQGLLGSLPLPTDMNGPTEASFLANVNNLVNNSFLNTTAMLNGYTLNQGFDFSPFGNYGSFLSGPFGAQLVNFPLTGSLTGTITAGTTTTTPAPMTTV